MRTPVSGGGNGGGVDIVDRGGTDCDAGRLAPTEGDSHCLICRVRRLRNDEVVVGISMLRFVCGVNMLDIVFRVNVHCTSQYKLPLV